MMHKRMKRLAPVWAVCLLFTACEAVWDEHYASRKEASTAEIEVVDMSVAQYIAGRPDLSQLYSLYESKQLCEALSDGNFCTAIVCGNQVLSERNDLLSHDLFVENTLSAVAVPPSYLTEGYGIYMRSGKNLWVKRDTAGNVFLNGEKITRIIKASNGYVYYVDAPIPVQPSMYEYIHSLGEDYSLFKEYISFFEEPYFDAEASTPSGTDKMGNTVYSDSVISVRNTLMDRYTKDGLAMWDMRSEAYQSTLFIPNNTLLRNAYENALDSIPYWMNRSATASDSLKFKKWIVSSCFVDRRLSDADVAATAEGQFACVSGYIRELDETADSEKYTEYEAAQWKPSVQKVDAGKGVDLSNGVAYFLTDYKVPNHIVIWRVKSRLYEIWAALDDVQRGWNASLSLATAGGYFRWNKWEKPLIVEQAQGDFELSATLPTMHYHVLTAAPSAEAQRLNLPVSVDYDGLLYSNERGYGLVEAHLPAGEYYLRMGFKHSLTYSISIYFCGEDEEFGDENCLIEDMSLIATGSNFHFDRGGAMEGLDFYGSESLGYPEDYDWRWWYDQDPVQYQKASAYDTDGYQVAVVRLKKSGNFKIKIASDDNAALYANGRQDRTKSDVNQLMMYHWCLRPTIHNY